MIAEHTDPVVLAAAAAGAAWADPCTDPASIDWPARQAAAAIPFTVVDGRPVNPCEQTRVRRGRNQLGHWGEQQCADALVVADDGRSVRWVLMVERDDGHGWALPGGYVDAGESAVDAAVRELTEETGLEVAAGQGQAWPARYVPDPRASDEAWMVTTVVRFDLGVAVLPGVAGADDAACAAWVRAGSYEQLCDDLAGRFGGAVFRAHPALLAEALD